MHFCETHLQCTYDLRLRYDSVSIFLILVIHSKTHSNPHSLVELETRKKKVNSLSLSVLSSELINLKLETWNTEGRSELSLIGWSRNWELRSLFIPFEFCRLGKMGMQFLKMLNIDASCNCIFQDAWFKYQGKSKVQERNTLIQPSKENTIQERKNRTRYRTYKILWGHKLISH